jgi:hypothetical protein
MAGLAVLTFLRPVAGILALLAMIPLFNSLAFHIPAGHFAPSMLLFWPTAAGWAAGRLWRKEAASAATPERACPYGSPRLWRAGRYLARFRPRRHAALRGILALHFPRI